MYNSITPFIGTRDFSCDSDSESRLPLMLRGDVPFSHNRICIVEQRNFKFMQFHHHLLLIHHSLTRLEFVSETCKCIAYFAAN